MSRSLFESLRAVGLQHHYDRLTSIGVRSLAHLTVLTLDDLPLLGITTMEDRTRLFLLVQQLRTLDPQTLLQTEAEEERSNPQRMHQAGAEEERSYPQRMYQTGAEGESHSATPNSQQCENKTWNDMSSVCRQLDFSSEIASEPPTGSTEESFDNPAANNSFRQDCGKLNSLLEKHVIRNVMKDDTDIKPKQNSKKSRRKTNKPTMDTENMRTPVYQSSPSKYNYGLPQTRFPPTPSKRRSGEPRIWVCVRKRPLTPAEERRQETDVVTSSGQSCVVHESRAAVDLTHYELQHKFYFDHVFGEDCYNEEVYQRTASPLVQHMLRGGSATCFAYGQTGAGKTHTMMGSSSGGCRGRCGGEPGLYALAAQDLFSHLSSSPSHLSVFVSFFEIYCGQLYDLLDHRKRLFAREDGQRNVHIAGLCYRRVESVQSLLQVISRGTEERSQGCSGVNPVSSRSHALLQIQLRGAGPRGEESRGDGQSVHGRMWFVDLAGSERASDSRNADRRSRVEGAEINQSLLALKECIRSLDQEQGHTPFRQSKLTQVLKDSFIGDSLTCMIANVSPGHCSTEHTLNTLRYADRVKELKGQRGQHRARQSKNAPSQKQNLSLSSGASRGRYRGSSPPKKPRTTDTVPPTPYAIRIHEDNAFLCSTPKNHPHNRDSRGRCDWISPVQSRPRVRREESEYREAKLWNQASNRQQNYEFGSRKIENEPSQSQRSYEWNALSRHFEDQEKRRHLKLYHQQLQQFDPLLTSSGLLLQNTSTNSPKANSHAMENMLTSSVAMEDILGRFEARIKQVQPCVSSSEVDVGLNNRKSQNLKYLVDETGAILRENRIGNNRKTKNFENSGAKCAWVSENEDISGNCLSLGDNIKNRTARRRLPVHLCDPRAPAERPLSPAAENSKSLLTLSDLNCSKMISHSPKHNQHNQSNEDMIKHGMLSQMVEEQSSVNMDPLRLSMLEEGQESSVSYLQQKPTTSERNQEAAVPVCSMVWGPEEDAEESYLEVPQAVGSSMVPWAIRFHSQPQGGAIQSAASTAQPVSALNDLVFNKSSSLAPHNSPQVYNNTTSCPQSQNSTAPPLGHSGNSSSEVLQSKGEERSSLNQSTCEEWTSGDHWLVVQAHLETLKQMERLSHREGTLLGQQPDMAFVEYVQQLEQIMRRKAVCVRSLISHLQTYLKTSHAQL